MAFEYTEIIRGLRIGETIFISGTVPPGTSGDSTTVPAGAFYSDTSSGKHYYKTTAGSGTDKWAAVASEAFVTSLSNALGHKKSVRVTTVAALPSYNASGSGVGKTLTASANGSINTTGIDGVTTLALNDRVLVQSENSGGAHVDHGIYTITDLGSAGTPWVLTRATDADEDSEVLDGQFVIVGEGTQAGYGFVMVTNNPITVDTTAIDYVRFGSDFDSRLGYLETFVGKGSGNETPDYSSNNYVTDGTSLETAIGALDAQVKLNSDEILQARTETTATNVTTITTVDSVLVDTVAAVHWIVHIQGNAEGDAAKKEIYKITAGHDGHNTGAGADATAAFPDAFRIKIGSSLSGLTVAVDVSGTGGSQVMRLRVSSTTAVDVRAIREVVLF